MKREEFLRNCFAKTLDECGIYRAYYLDKYSEKEICIVDNKSHFIVYGEHYNQEEKRKKKYFKNIIDAYHYFIFLICPDGDYQQYLLRTFHYYIYMDALKSVMSGPNGELPYIYHIGSYAEGSFCFNQTVSGIYIICYCERGQKHDVHFFFNLDKACEYFIRYCFANEYEQKTKLKEFFYLTRCKNVRRFLF